MVLNVIGKKHDKESSIRSIFPSSQFKKPLFSLMETLLAQTLYSFGGVKGG
jgi:hypothetical protein